MSKFKKGELVFVSGALDDVEKWAQEGRHQQLREANGADSKARSGFIQRFITKHKGVYYCESDNGSNIGLCAWAKCRKVSQDAPYCDDVERERSIDRERQLEEQGIVSEKARNSVFDAAFGPCPGCGEAHF